MHRRQRTGPCSHINDKSTIVIEVLCFETPYEVPHDAQACQKTSVPVRCCLRGRIKSVGVLHRIGPAANIGMEAC